MTVIVNGTTGVDLVQDGAITPAKMTWTAPLPVANGGTGVTDVMPYRMVVGTPIATTSGTSIDFTSIPSWVKRITVMLDGVSTNGTSLIQIQLGSGSVETTSYNSTCTYLAHTGTVIAIGSTTGLLIQGFGHATHLEYGSVIISLMGSNTWVSQGNMGINAAGALNASGGTKTLSGTLDRIRLTTVNGTDTFDAGSVNIMYEGY